MLLFISSGGLLAPRRLPHSRFLRGETFCVIHCRSRGWSRVALHLAVDPKLSSRRVLSPCFLFSRLYYGRHLRADSFSTQISAFTSSALKVYFIISYCFVSLCRKELSLFSSPHLSYSHICREGASHFEQAGLPTIPSRSGSAGVWVAG